MRSSFCSAIRFAAPAVLYSRAHGHVERAQELLGLRDRLRMRHHLVQLVERRPGQREQAVIDANDRLADQVQAVPEEQVVRLVDAPRLRVVQRNEAGRDATDLDCFENLADRRKRLPLRIGEDRERALLRICTCLALVRDRRHARSLASGAYAPPRRRST